MTSEVLNLTIYAEAKSKHKGRTDFRPHLIKIHSTLNKFMCIQLNRSGSSSKPQTFLSYYLAETCRRSLGNVPDKGMPNSNAF